MSIHHPPSRPRILKVKKIERETPSVKSIYFEDSFCSNAEPGQFVMVWMPRVDEIPMCLSYMNPETGVSAITVKSVGDATAAIHQLKEGDLFGVRGPYGTSFKPVGGRTLIVGGGVGVVPLLPLAQKLRTSRSTVTAIVGAESQAELLFTRRLKESLGVKGEVLTTTEDGTEGLKGYATDLLQDLFERESYRQIYACGPEPMLKKVLDLSLKHQVPAQLGLARYMKCGIGVCGSCVIGGLRVCKDGPVFSGKTLAAVPEFGVAERDAAGRVSPFRRQKI
jgi:dihydroorotate dehydrogenase electron transfer subunit